jgi:hypothetical protein
MMAETSHPYDGGYGIAPALIAAGLSVPAMAAAAAFGTGTSQKGRQRRLARLQKRLRKLKKRRGPIAASRRAALRGRIKRLQRMTGGGGGGGGPGRQAQIAHATRLVRAQMQWPPKYKPFEGSVEYPGQEYPGDFPQEQYVSETAYSPEGEMEAMMGYGVDPASAAALALAMRRRRYSAAQRRRQRQRIASVVSPAITQGPAPFLRFPGPSPKPIATFPQPWPPARLIKARIGSVRPKPAIMKFGSRGRPRGRVLAREGSVAAPMPNPITYPMQWEAWRRRYPKKAARWMRTNRSMYLRHKQALRSMRRRRRGGPQAPPARLIRQQGPVERRGIRPMPLTRFDPTRPGLESGMPVAPEEIADIAAEGEEAAMMEMEPGMDPGMKRLLLFGGLGVVALAGFAAMRKGKKKKTKKSAA